MRNPKLKPWLDAGIKRFAFQGVKGLSVKEMAKEIDTESTKFGYRQCQVHFIFAIKSFLLLFI